MQNIDKHFKVILLTIFLVLPLWAQAGTLLLSDTKKQINLTPYLHYIEDSSSAFTIDQVMKRPISQWQSPAAGLQNLNFGYTDSSYWLMLSINNTSQHDLVRYIEFSYPVLDYIDIYIQRSNSIAKEWHLGDKLPFDQRPIKHHHFIIPLQIENHEKIDLYIRVKSSSSTQIPIHLFDNATLVKDTSANVLSLGLYYGTMIVMILYNLFVFISVREVTYLYYVLFVAFFAIFLASLNGISYQYLWPNETWWNDQSIVFCLALSLTFGSLFTYNFLNIPRYKPMLRLVFKVSFALTILTILAAFVFPYAVMIRIVILESVIAMSVGICLGIIRWSEGDNAAKYYTISWSTLLVGGIILAFNKFNLLPRNIFTENATQIGSALEVILLSLALADRLNIEKRGRYKAQIESLENERLLRLAQAETLAQEQAARLANEKALLLEKEASEAQAQALDIQRKANETLELRVKERTTELEKANRKLEQLTFTDGLTHIRNRRYFDRVVQSEYQRAYLDQQPLSLLVIDIDRFKLFNDTYGHLIGDDCLRAVAHTIRGQIHRDTDIVARYGGEEFVVLMPNTDEEGAGHIAEKIRRQVELLAFRVNEEKVPVTVSIGGITHTPKASKEQDLFIASADEALYESKEKGRNRITLYAINQAPAKNQNNNA